MQASLKPSKSVFRGVAVGNGVEVGVSVVVDVGVLVGVDVGVSVGVDVGVLGGVDVGVFVWSIVEGGLQDETSTVTSNITQD